VHRVCEALRRSVPTERLYALSLGSQQGNPHLHWHFVAQPPGLAYGDQQLALLAKSVHGRLPFDPERNKALAKRIRANLNVL
jgi:histidine triad (HIT) family protein/ATP adenylyltransferase